MPKVVKIESFGDAEVMQIHEEEIAQLKAGEARVDHIAVGLNYLDISHRQGHYPLPLPTGLGVAGCGVIREIRSESAELAVGDLVTYAGVPPGSYAEQRIVEADRLVKLPPDIEPTVAAAALQHGITAAFLIGDVFAVARGHLVLVYAAAGGVGTILCQWAKSLGATVIGTVGSQGKVSHALAHGCDHVIVSTAENVAERVRAITSERGVDVAYDSVGADTFEASLNSLAFRGTLVSFGSASGEPPPVPVGDLAKFGSLYMTRPRFIHYTRTRPDLLRYSTAFFERIRAGLKVSIGQSYHFNEIVRAHKDIESRQTKGSSVITF
ncbi:quinone oxidoreductase [Paraburkholderia panacisoli]|uniref:Quinone oxidoreductase n=1 Tax=Paraburkholderia panacisoli TaxID=2603818 RepID=A0A5B0G2P4_9BURK|nr:quinone oxidoreductase [Paraburkholderia panacisoli]KAA0997767.1 quinone oxidoreductase [Paraburkholderia panacisoli]